MDKNTLRTALKARRMHIAADERTAYNTALRTHLLASSFMQQARVIHCYRSFGAEADTKEIIHNALLAGKRVLLPLTPAPGEALLHVEITAETCLPLQSTGFLTTKLLEQHKTVQAVRPASLLTHQDCVIVPLLGFDRERHRLGYGGGFYDRFLHSLQTNAKQKPHFVGIGFWCQFVEQGLLAEAHDIRLDAIFTERGLFA
jgi:5-formyltetrahydrofolate cyclo-ligase